MCYLETILERVSAEKQNQREGGGARGGGGRASGTYCYHNYLLSDDCRTSVDVDTELPTPLT